MIINVASDKEKVKSMAKLIKEREDFVKTIDHEKFSTNAAENYYEIIKELASALILLDGKKAVGDNAHKDLVDYLINYKDFSSGEIIFINDLRIKRNNSSYDGKKIENIYLKNHKNEILAIIKKLKEMIENRV